MSPESLGGNVSSGKAMDAAQLKAHAGRIIRILDRAYPDAKCTIEFSNPLELLVATILAAQCRDEAVNNLMRELFVKHRTAADWAALSQSALEKELAVVGLFRRKAERIRRCCGILAAEHGGGVPRDMDVLSSLPGIGRKSANLVLGSAYGIPGIVVDTHVKRVAKRLGLTRNADPAKIESDLAAVIPKGRWTKFSWQLIFHGRALCVARKPACAQCPLGRICPSFIET